MEYSSQKQINKLISAYNHNDYDLDDDLNDFNAVDEISEFENRLKSKKSLKSSSKKLKTNKFQNEENHKFSNSKLFENIVIPEFIPEINFEEEKQKKEHLRFQKIEIIENDFETIIKEENNSKIKNNFDKDISKYIIPINLQISDNKVLNKEFKKALQKNRDLFCDLQREKNLKREMEKKIENFQIKLEKIKELEKNVEKDPTLKLLTNSKIKLKKKEEKIASLNLQLGVKTKEIEKIKKILKEEIGKEIDINELIKNKGNWMGRSQQIELYKLKIKKLEKRKLSGKKREKSNDTIKKKNIKTNNNEIIYNLKKTNELQKLENENLIKKKKGVISRNKVLLEELKNIKKEFDSMKNNFKEKSLNDDNYISALKKLLKKMKKDQINLISKKNKEYEYKENYNNTNLNKTKIETIFLENEKYQKELAYKDKLIKKMLNEKMNLFSKKNNKFESKENLNNLNHSKSKIDKILLENEKYQRELNFKEDIIKKMRNENQFFDSKNLDKIPLKENFVKKITKLNKRISELEMENEGLNQLCDIPLNNSQNLKNLSKENLKLRMKINQLEIKVFSTK